MAGESESVKSAVTGPCSKRIFSFANDYVMTSQLGMRNFLRTRYAPKNITEEEIK